jgi:hypothetical protein
MVIDVDMLMLFKYLTFTLTKEKTSLEYIFGDSFYVLNTVHLPWTLLAFELSPKSSETFLCFMLVPPPPPSETVPRPGVTEANLVCSDFRRQTIKLI